MVRHEEFYEKVSNGEVPYEVVINLPHKKRWKQFCFISCGFLIPNSIHPESGIRNSEITKMSEV